jgi:hypothetical protein
LVLHSLPFAEDIDLYADAWGLPQLREELDRRHESANSVLTYHCATDFPGEGKAKDRFELEVTLQEVKEVETNNENKDSPKFKLSNESNIESNKKVFPNAVTWWKEWYGTDHEEEVNGALQPISNTTIFNTLEYWAQRTERILEVQENGGQRASTNENGSHSASTENLHHAETSSSVHHDAAISSQMKWKSWEIYRGLPRASRIRAREREKCNGGRMHVLHKKNLHGLNGGLDVQIFPAVGTSALGDRFGGGTWAAALHGWNFNLILWPLVGWLDKLSYFPRRHQVILSYFPRTWSIRESSLTGMRILCRKLMSCF